MLRRIVQQRSLHIWLQDLSGQQACSSNVLYAPSMQLTSLRHFSSPTEGSTGTSSESPPSGTTASEIGAESSDASAASSPSAAAGSVPPKPSSSSAMLQNAKLWRQWVDGKIDDRHRIPSYTSGNPGAAAGGARGSSPTEGGPPHQKYRPKDPAKDWKHTSRSLRSSQDRIASILVPESNQGPSYPGGKYGILGTAADAPKLVPGAAAKAEETSPDRLLPHRLFYPGATYSPDELDPYKAKPIGLLSDLSVRRGTISRTLVAGNSDFRNPEFLNNFISEAGKLQPRRKTRLPAKLHRELTRQVKLARSLALMSPTEKVRPPRPVRKPRFEQRQQQ